MLTCSNKRQFLHEDRVSNRKVIEASANSFLIDAFSKLWGEVISMDSNTKQIAKQRMQTLFNQAEKVFGTNPKLASRYIEVARKIGMAAKVRLPTEYKRRICRSCNALLVPGNNCRVRVKQKREPHLTVTCLACGHQTRILLRKKE